MTLHRWPTALGLVCSAGAIAVIVLVGREAEYFGPVVALMAGIYLIAYALGRPRAAWLAFAALSLVVTVLHFLGFPAIGMTAIVVLLWVWALARGRAADGALFGVQTAGTVLFGGLTLVIAAVEPAVGALLAGAGFLAHGLWDVHHFRTGRVVDRPWAELCAVFDLLVGTALIIAGVAA